jgi:hypothetical protein
MPRTDNYTADFVRNSNLTDKSIAMWLFVSKIGIAVSCQNPLMYVTNFVIIFY